MPLRRILPSFSCLLAVAAVAPSALADHDASSGHGDTPETLPAPTPPGTPGSTTVVAPPGSGGVTVVAPTAGGGQVTAAGCSTVVVSGQPTLIGPGGAPCPTLAPYQPYAPPPVYDVRPRYARDPDRTAALIGSAVGFGIGAAVTGVMYLVQYAKESDHCGDLRTNYYSDGTYRQEVDDSACGASRGALLAYGAVVTFVPSIPRFVVGDSTKGLVWTGLRGASFAAAALIDWGDDGDTKWQGPFLLGFAAPITLGIIDLATTPHREDLEPKAPQAGITSLSPVAVSDRTGRVHGGVLSLGGIF